MEFSSFTFIATIVVGLGAPFLVYLILSLRRVVPTNEVHIVQTRKKTTSYGKGLEAGNTYYEWPSWLPILGLTKVVLPVSVFDLDLVAYEAYDKERVPFVVDVKAFMRIHDSNTAAQRVEDFRELHTQLTAIVQGAVRTILASHEIDAIMIERSKFGEQFTNEVSEQLKQWGVEVVKNIELMDIRDASGSQVIHNIMAKRTSAIEMESRQVVAENKRKAEIAEIDAQRDVAVQREAAEQLVGLRTAEKERAVGVARETAVQEIKTQQRETTLRDMAVKEVADTRAAEIAKSVQVVKAEEQQRTDVIKADGEKQRTILLAEGQLEAKKREAEGIRVEGSARAEAEKAMQLAPVEAQIVLAKEIGGNQGYQGYLITIRQVEAAQAVGIAQASALEKADIKVISNSGDPVSGVTNVMDLFSSKGGTAVGGMLEALAQTPVGKAVIDKVVDNK